MEVRQTDEFQAWFSSLRDKVARARIDMRIKRLELGNFGDSKPVGETVHELKIDYGPGYRVYFTNRNRKIVVLLCGGDKSTQQQDIELAKVMARGLS